MDYNVAISGQSYTLSTSSDAEIAAVTACRKRRNDSMPQTVDGEPVTTERTVENRTPVLDGDGNPVLDENGEPTFTVTTSVVTDTTTPQVPNPALFATDEAYLQSVYANWATGNPGFTNADLQNSWAYALASWTSQNPPAQLLEQPLEGEALKTALKAYAAQVRYNKETGGMTVMGATIPTDRETQSKLSGAVLAFQTGALTGSIDWKSSSGWLTLDQAAVTGIATPVAAHVQAAFSAEKAVSEAIDAGTITTRADVDAANWG